MSLKLLLKAMCVLKGTEIGQNSYIQPDQTLFFLAVDTWNSISYLEKLRRIY